MGVAGIARRPETSRNSTASVLSQRQRSIASSRAAIVSGCRGGSVIGCGEGSGGPVSPARLEVASVDGDVETVGVDGDESTGILEALPCSPLFERTGQPVPSVADRSGVFKPLVSGEDRHAFADPFEDGLGDRVRSGQTSWLTIAPYSSSDTPPEHGQTATPSSAKAHPRPAEVQRRIREPSQRANITCSAALRDRKGPMSSRPFPGVLASWNRG